MASFNFAPDSFGPANPLLDYASNLQGVAQAQHTQALNQGAQQDLADRQVIRDNAQGAMNGDPSAQAAIFGTDPTKGAAFIGSLKGMQEAQRTQAAADLGASGDLAEAVLSAPAERQAEVWAQGRQALLASGHRNVPPEQFPGAGAMHVMRGLALGAKDQLSLLGTQQTTDDNSLVGYPTKGAPGTGNLSGWTGGAKGGGPQADVGVGDGSIHDAVHWNESHGRMNPGIVGDIDQSGAPKAFGPMQVQAGALNEVNQQLGTNFTPQQLAAQPVIGKLVGDSYLNMQRQKYGRDDYAMGAYNAGPGAMDAAIASGKGIAGLPASTQQYVMQGMARINAGLQARTAQAAGRGQIAQAAPAQPPAPQQMASNTGAVGMPQTTTDALSPPALASQAQQTAANAPPSVANPNPLLSVAQGAGPMQTRQNPFAAGASDMNALQGGMMGAGGPAAPPVIPQAQQAPEGLQPGEKWVKNAGTQAMVADPSQPGFFLARDSQGNRVARRLPGSPGAGVDTKIEGGLAVSTDKQTGKLVNVTPGLPDTSRTTTVAGPNGNIVMQSGKPIAVIPFSTQPAQIDAWKKDQDQARTVAQQSGQAEQQLQQVLEGRDLAKGLPTGTGGQSRAAISNWLQTYAPASVYDSFVKGGYLPDAAQAQEAAKVFLKQAGTDEKTQGGSGGLGLTQMYANANPNLDLSPKAIQDISNLKAVSAQATKDYGDGFLKHFNKQSDSLLHEGGSYDSTSNYDQQWYGQKNVRTYLAATNAMNGKPYAEWSKNLAPEDQDRARQIIGRIDPSTEISGPHGKMTVDGQPIAAGAPASAASAAPSSTPVAAVAVPQVRTADDYNSLPAGTRYVHSDGTTRQKPAAAPFAAAPAPSQAQPSATGQPQQVRTPADYGALPSGSLFTDTNGNTRRKP